MSDSRGRLYIRVWETRPRMLWLHKHADQGELIGPTNIYCAKPTKKGGQDYDYVYNLIVVASFEVGEDASLLEIEEKTYEHLGYTFTELEYLPQDDLNAYRDVYIR